jgi:NAD(P)H-dependent FMN reductase
VSTAQTLRLLAISGSARKNSLNTRLMRAAVRAAATAGATVTVVDMAERPLPLYDGDLEESAGIPSAAMDLKALFATHDGWLVVSPEYNGFFSPLIKNTIDWLSRPVEGQASPFAGKVAAVLGASPGALGGIRMLPHLRLLLSNLGVTVVPAQLALAKAHEAFNDAGDLADAGMQAALNSVVGSLLTTTRAIATARTA